MGLLPDKQNCAKRMHRECREQFPAGDFKGKALVSVTHVPWCMSGSLARGGGGGGGGGVCVCVCVLGGGGGGRFGIPGACATRNFMYLARGPWSETHYRDVIMGAMMSQITDVSGVNSAVFFQAEIKENMEALRAVNTLVTSQRASNAENVSIWGRHHAGEDFVATNGTKVHMKT